MVYTISGIRLPCVSSVYKSSSGSSPCSDRRNTNLSLLLRKDSFPRKISSGKSSCDSDSLTVAASEKILVPGTRNDASPSSTDQLEASDTVLEDQVLRDADHLTLEDDNKGDVEVNYVKPTSDCNEPDMEQGSVPSLLVGDDDKVQGAEIPVPSPVTGSNEDGGSSQKFIPPPGTGQRIYEIDPLLREHRGHLNYRYGQYKKMRESIDKYEGGLENFSRGYEKMGFTRSPTGVTYREWAPGAKSAVLIGDFNNWNPNADVMTRDDFGIWEIFLPNNVDGSPAIPHGSRVKIRMDTPSGIKDSIPAWIKFSVQAPGEIPYNGIYYDPPEERKHIFQHPQPNKPKSLRIYEAHVGMSSTEPMINTYANFRDEVLPRIKKLGYNAVQLMAIQEHSYYASFGYHVTNFFAPSSRCGTPDDLKSLIDKAHELGLLVLMDIVHSHASNNVLDGLNMFDGTDSHYFHSGSRGYHWMWDSRLFNYGSWEVLRFLLSNARWWLDEYKFDGFRFDGVTSMMYTHHGLQVAFTGNYNEYFGLTTDVDAVVYLMLVNDLIHGLFPEAVTIGEDVSGMPAFCIPVQDGGVGFDYRLQMAIADKWIELLKKRDEDWEMGEIVFTLTNRRWLEKCVAYAESHDQALVGDKTIAFWLMDKDMYDFMALDRPSTLQFPSLRRPNFPFCLQTNEMKRPQRLKRVTESKEPIQPSDPNSGTIRSKSLTVRAKPKSKSKPKLQSQSQSRFPLVSISEPSFGKTNILGPEFFQIDALDLAPRLLGKFLKKDDVVLQITEVEAYRPNDSACHGRFGITPRTAPVFGPGGHAYVYLCYGLHTMLNIVADKDGVGAAVLIRSCAPVSGLETIQQRRNQKTEKPVLLTGPGKIGQALGISTEWSNHPLYTPDGLEVLDGPEPENILIGPRVGIEYALPEHVSALWRFAIAGTPWISAPKNTFKATMILTSRGNI